MFAGVAMARQLSLPSVLTTDIFVQRRDVQYTWPPLACWCCAILTTQCGVLASSHYLVAIDGGKHSKRVENSRPGDGNYAATEVKRNRRSSGWASTNDWPFWDFRNVGMFGAQEQNGPSRFAIRLCQMA